MDDGTLEAGVESALSKDQQLKKDARVVATAYQGKVLLTGQSPNADLTARAKQIAMGVEGTTEVYNEIRQGTPVSLSTASSDTRITTKVRSQLLTSDTVKSSNVKVTTENGEVFLLGWSPNRKDSRRRRSPAGQRREARHHRLYLCEVIRSGGSGAVPFPPV